jgi:hypothetical protein
MLRKIHICALQVDAGRRPRWITPCKRSVARGMGYLSGSELRSSSTRSGVVETRCITSLPRAAPVACTGLSESDAFRRQPEVQKKSCVTSVHHSFLIFSLPIFFRYLLPNKNNHYLCPRKNKYRCILWIHSSHH